MEKIILNTASKVAFIDITEKIGEIVKNKRISGGVVTIFVPHTTAAVTINENADKSVCRDMEKGLERIIPFKGDYLHEEGNSSAHIKSSLVGNSETVFIEEGRLCLGTWQGIFFCEFDGPRKREVWVRVGQN